MTSIIDDKFIYRIARKNPKYSAKQIAQEVNLAFKNQISRQTINRRLIDCKLCCFVAARKPLLKPTDRLKQIKFCKAIFKMSNYELRRIVFSDEPNYTVINCKNKVIIRRHHNEKYNNCFIVPRLQGGGGSVSIWGCITCDGPGLYMLYSSQMDQHSYIDTLEKYLMPTFFLVTSPSGCFNKITPHAIKQNL